MVSLKNIYPKEDSAIAADHHVIVQNILRRFIDPATGLDVYTAHCLQGLVISNGCLNGMIEIDITLKDQYEQLSHDLSVELNKLPFINNVLIVLTTTNSALPQSNQQKLKATKIMEKLKFPTIKKIIAVASGKGGVGKSTVAVNIAMGLQQMGYQTGLMDADIYGPSIPKMLGLRGQPKTSDDKKFIPHVYNGLKCMSMGFLIDEQTPVIWRGPVVQSSFQKLLADTQWQDLDVLVIDLPPGTGDIHLTMVQKIELAGVVIVSTPQDLALIDARRAIAMFQKMDTPIIGIIENMGTFICPHCQQASDIFNINGARDEGIRSNIPYLGTIPLHMDIRKASDQGLPIAMQNHQLLNMIMHNIMTKITQKIFP